MKGFFVYLSRKKNVNGVVKNSATLWKAVPVEDVRNWLATTGESPQVALDLQREQYRSKLQRKESVPLLVGSTDGPMASGQRTRFVAV
ncbi:MAG TPA: hypothetical protein VL625_11225 [Patescibacteria group bacterium]|nr:hypothetical protein [Patescibacteria group bacterium]